VTNAASTENSGGVWPSISESLLLHFALNSSQLSSPPFLTLVVGKDSHSWALRILAAERSERPRRQRVEVLTNARWRKDLLELPDVALLAQSALRKVSIERGWPIP
jgi:hypothetical protein